jgi:hypothetical protein
MQTDAPQQLLLPTDKRNPTFSIYRQEDTHTIHVYYGLELLEVVPDDRNHPQFKLLVANLYNAGLKVASLETAFECDRKTMRSWGLALKSGDAEQLKRALEGREGRRKLTPVISGFIEMRFEDIYARFPKSYSQKLRAEVLHVFKVKLSGETLRPLFQSLLSKRQPKEEKPVQTQAQSSEVAVAVLPTEPEGEPGKTGELGCESTPQPPGKEPASSNPPPDPTPWSPGQTHWSDHLGILLFSKALIEISEVTQTPEPLLKQWLASVLLGCHNVEQTKYLNQDDLTVLLGDVKRFTTPQREQLERLANGPTIQAVWRWNHSQVEQSTGAADYYLDPHTKHYTGMKPILKGWCATIRWADKALHSDYLHSVKGEAIYCQCADNFADLRQRLWNVLSRARQVLDWPQDKVITCIIDRGVFGMEVFEKILADPFVHLITWEKGYIKGQWCAKEQSGEFTLERKRNRADDVRTYRFRYITRTWAKNPQMQQFIVLATNPAGKEIEVSVLCTDPKRPSQEAIQLIFNRWIQENDFKYLDKHFGINQITSYRTIEYAKLAGQVEDRQIQSGQAKALVQKGRHLKTEQSRQLVEQERADHEHQQRLTQIAKLETSVSNATSQEDDQKTQALHRLRQATQRYEEKRVERRKKIEVLNGQIDENETQKQTVQQKESRLAQLIAQGMHRLDTAQKELMDTIKVSARNLFYHTLQPFKKAYDNYRDDHDYFRKLTHSGGVLRWTGSEFHVHLVPQVNYSPALKRIIRKWLEEVNASQPVMPDGSGRPIRFILSDRDDFEIRIK